jgi:MOSC domain
MERHLTTAELEAGLDEIRRSPADDGVVELVVARPEVGGRTLLDEGRLDLDVGLVGDNWLARGNGRRPDGSADPEAQLNVINARVSRLVAVDPARRPLAGDQLHVDLDLSVANLPPGTRLALGTAVIEVTPPPHTGCAKFVERFGREAMRFVNSPAGRDLRLRGLNARVVEPGTVCPGDTIRKVYVPELAAT